MLRDGLAAEYPSLAYALRRLRRPTVPREPWVWAALTGLGASAVASAVLQVPLIGLRMADLRDPAAYAGSIVAILAAAIGLAVAWRAGRSRAVALYLGVHLVYSLAALPGIVVFCDRSGETNCFARFAIGQWRTLASLVVAIAAATLVRSGALGRSPTLSATGAYVAVRQVLSVPMAVIAFGLIPAGGPSDPMMRVAYASVADVVAAGVSGMVLGVRGARWYGMLVPIGVIALNWGLGLWPLLGLEQKPPWTLLSAVTGPAQVIALVVAQAVARRRAW